MSERRLAETDDEFWGRLLGADDPCAPGKDWAAAAFDDGMEPNVGPESTDSCRLHNVTLSPEQHPAHPGGDQ